VNGTDEVRKRERAYKKEMASIRDKVECSARLRIEAGAEPDEALKRFKGEKADIFLDMALDLVRDAVRARYMLEKAWLEAGRSDFPVADGSD